MSRLSIFIVLLLIVNAVASCNSRKEEKDHGHAHDAHGNHLENDVPILSKTIWTDKTEMFVEFPALVVGQASSFATHFTQLEEHAPVREGVASVTLVKNGRGIRDVEGKPTSPGIYRLGLRPKEAGEYQLIFEIKGEELSDKIVIPNVTVYSDSEAAKASKLESDPSNSISFLKEQAWKIEFETQPVHHQTIFKRVASSGVWKSTQKASRKLIAPVDGVVEFKKDELTPGTVIKKGEVLYAMLGNSLTDFNLSSELKKAQATFDQAEKEFERKRDLLEEKIVPTSEFEKAQQAYELAKVELETLQENFQRGGKLVPAPFDGTVVKISQKNGEFITEGTTVLTLQQFDARILECQVGMMEGIEKDNIHTVLYKNASEAWMDLQKEGGKILAMDNHISSDKPNLKVYALVHNAEEAIEGALTEVEILHGKGEEAIVIPTVSLLEDYGVYSVVVQRSGESFERRPVQVGRSNGKWTEILEGIKVGERVVTKGMYQVKMASMSGQAPAHGHAH